MKEPQRIIGQVFRYTGDWHPGIRGHVREYGRPAEETGIGSDEQQAGLKQQHGEQRGLVDGRQALQRLCGDLANTALLGLPMIALCELLRARGVPLP